MRHVIHFKTGFVLYQPGSLAQLLKIFPSKCPTVRYLPSTREGFVEWNYICSISKVYCKSEPLRESSSVTNSMVVPGYNYSCSRHGYCITYQSCASFINKLYLLSLTACKKSSDSKGILLKEDVKLQNRHSEPLPDTDRNFAGKSEREKISRKHSSQTVCSSPYAKKGP